MPLHESSNIKFRLLEHLHLANVALLDWEDGRSRLLNILTTICSHKSVYKSPEISLVSELGHIVHHLGSDTTNLSGFGITSLLDLTSILLGEGNTEHSYNVSIGGLNIYIRLNNCLTLLNETAYLITCHVHSVEIGETVISLYILNAELDLAVGEVLVILEVGEGYFDDASFQFLGGDFGTGCFGDDGFSKILVGEHCWCLELVPFFSEEGVNSLLTASLLSSFCQSLVLSDCHGYNNVTRCAISAEVGREFS
mmetsp:Transcript_3015/g.5639  ORF Transcript_3015/g.5639 Transcript_3015/m.5639 type:complete len:253 (+) Transcript_3015:139-897(+)